VHALVRGCGRNRDRSIRRQRPIWVERDGGVLPTANNSLNGEQEAKRPELRSSGRNLGSTAAQRGFGDLEHFPPVGRGQYMRWMGSGGDKISAGDHKRGSHQDGPQKGAGSRTTRSSER